MGAVLMAEMDDHSFGDQILAEAQRSLASGVDLDDLAQANGHLGRAILKQAKALSDAEFQKNKAVQCPHCSHSFKVEVLGVEALAKALNHACKSLDGNARLGQFLNGKSDSRPDLGGAFGLAGLKPAQLDQVMAWLEENERELSHRD